jgi:hypothetical protein
MCLTGFSVEPSSGVFVETSTREFKRHFSSDSHLAYWASFTITC